MKNSKYSNAFEDLSRQLVFTASDGRRVGIPSRMLAYFCLQGMMERIHRGVYRVKDNEQNLDSEWEDLFQTAMTIPNGVVCLISALCFYDLTDEIMREFWIAVPHSTSSPRRENTRIVRMRNISLGITSVKFKDVDLKIFDEERTIIDAFRYLDIEVAIKALKAYLKKSRKPDMKKLLYYAKLLRVNITPYLMALT